LKYLFVGFFGLIGVFSRYGINLIAGSPGSGEFPWGTFLINMSGSLLIGIVYVLAIEKSMLSDDLKTGLMVGLLGGFTTFSAFSLESMALFKNGNVGLASIYLFGSSFLGISLAFCGAYVARILL
jgi:CrcB protein